MAFLNFDGVGISALSACVPPNIVDNSSSLSHLMSKDEIDKVLNNIGVKERRVARSDVSPSDLCFQAAENLLDSMDINRDEIDMLIFMTQLPDYRLPASSPSLQHRLRLPKSTACFDISLACSGYVYSLSTAFAYASLPNVNKILLLDGETFSKIVSDQDKVNLPLYGDAGTATLIEKGSFGKSYFSLNSDGNGVDAISIKAGGARYQVDEESIKITERENGNFRSDNQLFMDGMDVFNFTMKEVPKDIKGILGASGLSFDDIDQVVFHQANKFMIDFFKKRLKISDEKMNYSIGRYGNTSSATIPLTIASELSHLDTEECQTFLLSGFGAGLSWASAVIDFYKTKILPVKDYEY